MTYLGLDICTSGVKALLIGEDGTPLGEATAPAVEPVRPKPGWSEQNPADWWTATLGAIDALKQNHAMELEAVKGIGLSGHMHGATLLGENDEVLRPCILWNDGRSAAECAEMEAALPALRDIAGNIAMPGFTAPKIAWVRKNEPQIYEKIKKVLLPKAYVRLLLTGEHVEEMSDAAGTLWLDVARRDWSDALLAVTGLTRAHMPRLVEGSAPSAQLKSDLAARWGMSGPVIVAGGAGDNAAAACGSGRSGPARGLFRSALGRAVCLEREILAQYARCTPSVTPSPTPGTRWGDPVSHRSLNWLSRISGKKQAALRARRGVRGPGEEIFLPIFRASAPHNNADARARLWGPAIERHRPAGASRHGRRDLCHARLPARLADAGTRIDRLLAVGGDRNRRSGSKCYHQS